MSLLILIRHGESQWNLENRFTGWVDVDLSDKGRQEAEAAVADQEQAGYRAGCIAQGIFVHPVPAPGILLPQSLKVAVVAFIKRLVAGDRDAFFPCGV